MEIFSHVGYIEIRFTSTLRVNKLSERRIRETYMEK